MERKLAAILAADVVGYTRLMGVNEAGTLRRLTDLREKILEPLIAEHHGRVVKLMGDGLLVEFASAVDSVACAIAWQDRMALHETDRDTGTKLQFRIGINLGDIIVEGDDIHGDGVNIAARLEGLAQPGGICLSDDIYRHAKSKINARFEDMGEQALKNVADPVRVYTVAVGQSGATAPVPTTEPLPLPDKPSIAVLPFDNMSNDPEQEYFSDGITEDIITELSRFNELRVIARNSAFQFKGQPINFSEIGQRLGARYIVEGSVRKYGNRIRVTAQLIEAETGSNLWAERYDRTLENIFEVQDELVQSIAGMIPEQIEQRAVRRVRSKPTANMTAFDCLLRGRWALHHTSDGVKLAIDFLEQALVADPDYAQAHALLAYAYPYSVFVLGSDPDATTVRAHQHAEKATRLDPTDPEVNAAVAIGFLLSGEHDRADAYSARATSLNPNDHICLYSRALTLAYLGQQSEAMDVFARMAMISPYAQDDVRADGYCDCLYMLGRYEEILDIYRRWQGQLPDFLVQLRAVVEVQLGNQEAAKRSIAEYEASERGKLDPMTFVRAHMRMVKRPEDRERWLEGYRKVGLCNEDDILGLMFSTKKDVC